MTNEDLYKLTLTILRKESRGNIIKPDRFSELLNQCHYEYYAQQYDKWDVTQGVHDSLRPFLEQDTITFTTGIGTIPSTYRHADSAYTSTAEIDIVTPREYSFRQADELTQPTTAKPVLIVAATELRIYPTTITTATFNYLSEADYEPFFDYYIDAQRNIQGMSSTYGTSYTLQTNEIYRDGTVAPNAVTSINRELEWLDKDKINILSFILEKIGVSLSGDIAQYAMAKEQQQNIA